MKKALYILAEISDRDFEWLISVGRSNLIPAGTALIREGEPINALYIVLEGLFTVSVEALNSLEIAQLGDGEVVGEISFIDSRRPSATVKAIKDSLVWSIPRAQLATKLSQDPAFASHFYQSLAIFLSDRLRNTIKLLGSSKDHQFDQDEIPESEINPKLSGNLELAKARLDWMIQRLKGVH